MKRLLQARVQRIPLFISTLTAILFVGSTNFAFAMPKFIATRVAAATANVIGGVGYDVVSTFAFGASYLIAAILGIAIAMETWVLGIVLTINEGVLQTPTVQTGFSISLSIANLVFVLGIIVIAIATILRNNSYGIKQLLWKLVVMAILVNFGLVIMAPIFALGNSLSQYFINCIGPTSGGCTQSSSGVSSFNSFAMTFTEAFNPQAPITSLTNASSGADSVILNQGSNLNSAFSVSGSVGSDIGKMVVPLFGIVFTAIDLALIDFILLAFIVMLFIRYIYIAILAILLPFAWASWVFPGFSYHWKNWWNKFLQWTFFAPIVLFFIYISLVWAKSMGTTFSVQTYTNSTNSLWVAINNFVSGLISPILEAFVQEIILGGLIIGGMIAANSMGIKLAGAVVKTVENGGRAVRNKAWNYGKERTAERLQTMGRRTRENKQGKMETTTWLQRRAAQLQRVPFVGEPLASVVSTAGSPEAFHEKHGEDIKKYAAKNLRALPDDAFLDRVKTNSFADLTKSAGMSRELARRNLTEKIPEALLRKYMESSERVGDIQEIFNNRPELAAMTGAAQPRKKILPGGATRPETPEEARDRAIAEAVKKIKVSDAANINENSLGTKGSTMPPTDEQKVIIMSLTPQQLSKIGSEGGGNAAAFKNSVTQWVAAATTPGAPPLPPATLNNLNKLWNHVNTAPGWDIVP